MLTAAVAADRMPATAAGAARARARYEAHALVAAEALVRPATAFRVWPVRSAQGARIDLGPRVIVAAGFAGCAGATEAVAAAACTLGPRLEQRVAALFAARRALLAFELDAIGTERLYALADRLAARIRRAARRAGWGAGAALHPGDAGMALDEQQAVLALAGAGTQGIAASAAGMLRPVKSLAFVVALGRAVSPPAGARCDRCGARARCRIRPA
ncbi:MAG: hypothetical protein U1F45_03085 [Burkholderiales bacterium]